MVGSSIQADDVGVSPKTCFMFYEIVNDDGGVALPLFLSDVMAVNDKVAMPSQIGNNWELDGMKNAERWWFS